MTLGMGIPRRAAAATSNLMVGITAIASAYIYYTRGMINPLIAAPVIIGTFLGALIELVFRPALGLGIVLMFYSPVQEIHTLSLGRIFEAMFQFRPEGFINFGLIILLATPVAGVVGAIIGFVATRDWPYAGVSGAVFLVLLISIFIGGH